jgi:hypothetical protein
MGSFVSVLQYFEISLGFGQSVFSKAKTMEGTNQESSETACLSGIEKDLTIPFAVEFSSTDAKPSPHRRSNANAFRLQQAVTKNLDSFISTHYSQ